MPPRERLNLGLAVHTVQGNGRGKGVDGKIRLEAADVDTSATVLYCSANVLY